VDGQDQNCRPGPEAQAFVSIKWDLANYAYNLMEILNLFNEAPWRRRDVRELRFWNITSPGNGTQRKVGQMRFSDIERSRRVRLFRESYGSITRGAIRSR
jgi:hypothetical protein